MQSSFPACILEMLGFKKDTKVQIQSKNPHLQVLQKHYIYTCLGFLKKHLSEILLDPGIEKSGYIYLLTTKRT